MPGENCCIVGCGTSRREKNVGIWKLPTPSTPARAKWREELLRIITRDRVVDDDFKRLRDKDRLHICQKHFADKDCYICKYI